MQARGHGDWWGFWLGEEHQDARQAMLAEVGPRPGLGPRGDWREAPAPLPRINLALLVAMRELLRPVYVRDAPINILGRCGVDVDPAAPSRFAGYGVPLGALEHIARPRREEGTS